MLRAIQLGVKEVGMSALPNTQLIELAKQREGEGHCITGEIDGDIIGVGGIDKGVANMWMLVTPLIDLHVCSSYRAIRDSVHKLFVDNDLWRAETYGRVDFPQCHILLKHLGFKVEGLARKRMPDKVDAIMYAKVR